MDVNFATNLVGNVGLMFVIVLLGYFIKLSKQGLDDIAKLVVDLGIPALIFSSFISGFNKELFRSMFTVLSFVLASVLVGYGISFLVIRGIKLKQERSHEFFLASIYGNTGFIGIPLCLAAFGKEGALLAAVFDFGMTFVLFTLGLPLLRGGKQGSFKGGWKNLINPPTGAFFAGLLFTVMGITIHPLVINQINALGTLTTPLAMIFVGGMLSQMEAIEWYSKSMTCLILTKLIMIPVTIGFLIKTLGITSIAAAVILLQTATPTMISAPLLVQRYKGNANFSTSAVFVTTLLSIVTIPLIMCFFQLGV